MTPGCFSTRGGMEKSQGFSCQGQIVSSSESKDSTCPAPDPLCPLLGILSGTCRGQACSGRAVPAHASQEDRAQILFRRSSSTCSPGIPEDKEQAVPARIPQSWGTWTSPQRYLGGHQQISAHEGRALQQKYRRLGRKSHC